MSLVQGLNLCPEFVTGSDNIISAPKIHYCSMDVYFLLNTSSFFSPRRNVGMLLLKQPAKLNYINEICISWLILTVFSDTLEKIWNPNLAIFLWLVFYFLIVVNIQTASFKMKFTNFEYFFWILPKNIVSIKVMSFSNFLSNSLVCSTIIAEMAVILGTLIRVWHSFPVTNYFSDCFNCWV